MSAEDENKDIATEEPVEEPIEEPPQDVDANPEAPATEEEKDTEEIDEKQQASDIENVISSTLSTKFSFSILYKGSQGETGNQIAGYFEFNTEDETHTGEFEELKETTESLVEIYSGEFRAPLIAFANRLYIDEAHIAKLRPSFKRLIRKKYFAPLKPESAIPDINKFVKKATKGKVQDLLEDGDIPVEGPMVLVNVTYIRGAFEKVFNPNDTVPDAPFYTDLTRSVVRGTCEMMSVTHTIRVLSGKKYDMVFYPYRASPLSLSDLSLFLALVQPKVPDAPPLTAKNIFQAKQKTKRKKIKLSVPKFQFASKINITEKMQNAGVIDPFDPDRADFIALAEDSREDPLFLASVIQCSFVRVDEAGADATKVKGRQGGGGSDAEIPEFRFDCPFQFFILDADMFAVLFEGKVEMPTF